MRTRDQAALARRSLELLLELQDPGGAFPAGPDFSAYRGFCWFRDGAFIADAVSAAGAVASATAFHDWCARFLVSRRAEVADLVSAVGCGEDPPEGAILPARLLLDGTPANDGWSNFQVDGYGTWLWALAEHVRRHGLDPARWATAIEVAVDYLVVMGDRPCYDWWEEDPGQRHVSTLGCVCAGLIAAVDLGTLDLGRRRRAEVASGRLFAAVVGDAAKRGHLGKVIGRPGIDASALALIGPIRMMPSTSRFAFATIEQIEQQLVVEGGTHRYPADRYYGGGRWPLLTGFLGLAADAVGRRALATACLDWIVDQADDRGRLPEQVGGHLLHPDGLSEWTERWGPPADPLLWSSAMYVRLAVQLGVAGT
ncbi:MAG TPA: glycoside hydrolase family 15 protein [Pseudolysinimonas sp.]|nr:glycoside hydrolase family 15 protein [Pseudolysinimonas sp.]